MALGGDDAKIFGQSFFGGIIPIKSVVIIKSSFAVQSPLAVGRFNEEYGKCERSE